jgi:Type II secretion system (T2SS), protein E, N-terminal domain
MASLSNRVIPLPTPASTARLTAPVLTNVILDYRSADPAVTVFSPPQWLSDPHPFDLNPFESSPAAVPTPVLAMPPAYPLDAEQVFSLIDKILPFEACLYHQILPLAVTDKTVHLGMVNLDDVVAMDYSRRILAFMNYTLAPQTVSSETHHGLLSAYLNRQSQPATEKQPDQLALAPVALTVEPVQSPVDPTAAAPVAITVEPVQLPADAIAEPLAQSVASDVLDAPDAPDAPDMSDALIDPSAALAPLAQSTDPDFAATVDLFSRETLMLDSQDALTVWNTPTPKAHAPPDG